MRFEYCPLCGRRLVGKKFPNGRLIPCCVPCGHVYDNQPFSGVLALAVNAREEVALLRRHGTGDVSEKLPEGKVLAGESGEEAAARAVREELGLTPREVRYVGSCPQPTGDTLFLGYAVRVECDVFFLPDEVDAAVWLPLEQALYRLSEGTRWLLREYIKLQEGTV